MNPAARNALMVLRSVFLFSAAALFIAAPFLTPADEGGGRMGKVLVASIGLVIFNVECWTWWRRMSDRKRNKEATH